jgi:putative copper resistance protein D
MNVSPALVLLRLVTFAAAMLLFGSSLFALYAPREATVRRGPRLGSIARLSRAVALGTGVLLVGALLGWLPAVAAGMNDASDPLPLGELMRTVLLETSFGPVWAVQLGLAVLLLGVVLAGASVRVVLAVAAAVLASEAWVGHAAMEAGIPGALRRGVMVVHLLAAGAWLGGLVPLSRLLLEARRVGRGPLLAAACTALRRFSRVGYVAVGLILLSGAAETYLLLGAAERVSATPYVTVLATKLVLVALLLGVALTNRFGLVPRLGASKGTDLATLSALRRNVVLEHLLGLLVLAAVSVLGLPPPRAS